MKTSKRRLLRAQEVLPWGSNKVVEKRSPEAIERRKEKMRERDRRLKRSGPRSKEAIKRRRKKSNRAAQLKKYGIKRADYDRMLTEQNGVCRICQKPETSTCKGVLRSLSVDHSHATNAVRGLLCSRCNSMLGQALDQPAILRAGAAYLESYEVAP